ncbi:MAG: hypothetical protein OEY62_08140 [Acidimicrobiia bacterium]|nr:hypothetical protein [Acidimicrobiia bacterium]
MTFSRTDDIAAYVGALSNPVACIVLGRHLAEGFIPHRRPNHPADSVVFENERVRVLDVRADPGSESPMHSHPDSVMYARECGRDPDSHTRRPRAPRGSVCRGDFGFAPYCRSAVAGTPNAPISAHYRAGGTCRAAAEMPG